MKKYFLFFIFLGIYESFSQEERFQISTIAFYNVENLFDAVDDPENYWDQRWLEEGTWNEEIYKKKIENISSVIPQIGFLTLRPKNGVV